MNSTFLIFEGEGTTRGVSHGPMVESRTPNRKVAGSSLGPAGIVGGGVNVQHSLHPQYHDEVPLSKAPNPQLLPGRYSMNGCPLLLCSPLCVCVCSLCVCVHGVCVFTVCVCALWMG